MRSKHPARKLDDRFLHRCKLDRARIESIEDYPFCLPAVRAIDQVEFHPKVTYFVGENGSGKSTIMEAIAVAIGLNPEGGSKNYNFATRSSHSQLGDVLTVVRGGEREKHAFFLRAESFYNVATEVERLGGTVPATFGDKPLHTQSHGESFMAFAQNRIWPRSVILMDEPEAALSPNRQLEMLAFIHHYATNDSCQFIIASHSPILLAYPDSTMYRTDGDGLSITSYEDTDHYRTTSHFLQNYKAYVERLMR